MICNESRMLHGYSFLISLLATVIASYYAYTHITADAGLPYDLDGWGFLIERMATDSACWVHTLDAYNPYRGWFLPFVYGASYCVFQVPESVQIVNLLLFFLSCYVFILYFSNHFKSPFEAGLVVLVWAVWPAHTYIYGYYFSEIPGALLVILAVVSMLKFIEGSKKTISFSIFLGLTLGLLLHIRSSSLFFVAGITLVLFWGFAFKPELRKYTAWAIGALVLSYSTLPIANYAKLGSFVPLTTQGGFALYEGTFIPGDDLPANAIRAISKEFRDVEAEAASLAPYEQDKFYKQKALENIVSDPQGQLLLFGKKLLRFWMYIPGHSWVPTTKSLIVGVPVFVMWLFSIFLLRRDPRFNLITYAVISTWLMHALIHSEYRYSYVVLPLILFQCMLAFKKMSQIALNYLFGPKVI